MDLLCKDGINRSDPDVYRIILRTQDGKGDRFIPGGKHSTIDQRSLIYAVLTRPDIVLDLMVELVCAKDLEPAFTIVDTQYTYLY